MAIEKAEFTDAWDVTCDMCSEYEQVDAKTFQGAIDVIKQEGWFITRDEDGEWVHICPDPAHKPEGMA